MKVTLFLIKVTELENFSFGYLYVNLIGRNFDILIFSPSIYLGGTSGPVVERWIPMSEDPGSNPVRDRLFLLYI